MKNQRDSNFTYLHNFIECCLHWKPHYRYYLCFYHHHHHRCNGVDSYFGASSPKSTLMQKRNPFLTASGLDLLRWHFTAWYTVCLLMAGKKYIYLQGLSLVISADKYAESFHDCFVPLFRTCSTVHLTPPSICLNLFRHEWWSVLNWNGM